MFSLFFFYWTVKELFNLYKSYAYHIISVDALMEIRSLTLAEVKQCFTYLSMDEKSLIWVKCEGMQQRYRYHICIPYQDS